MLPLPTVCTRTRFTVARSRAWTVIPALVLGLSACGDDDLPEYARLDRLRFLAISVDQPEVSAGTAGLVLTPHVSDPQGAGRVLSFSAEACIDPGVGYGATPSCTGNPSRVTSGTITVGAATFTPGTAPHYTGVGPLVTVDVPAASVMYADPRTGVTRPAYEQHNGVSYLVVLRVAAPSGEALTSFKRILVSTRAVKNTGNPALGTVTVEGVASTAPPPRPTAPVTLSADISASEEEAYVVQSAAGPDTTVSEVLTTTWFVSGGEVSSTRTARGQTTVYTPPEGSDPLTFFVVLRDDRGGTSVQNFSL